MSNEECEAAIVAGNIPESSTLGNPQTSSSSWPEQGPMSISMCSIMSYTAKYASSLYGTFREALDSNPCVGDEKTEVLIETREDEFEGADILLVKPGLPYLDITRLLQDNSPLPISAYQVSGEYFMIKAGGVLKMIDEERVMMKSQMCLRRAGADIILTYFALQAARCFCGEKR